MTSAMARDDIEALKDDGIDLTVDEIVRINAFGLRVERGAESAELYNLPRAAILGDVVFHEPTIGSDIWLKQVGALFDLDEYDTFTQLRALSMSMDYDKLPDPANKELVMKCVDELLGKLSCYTRRQLENALLYCIEGNFDFANEPTPVSNKRTSDIDWKDEDYSNFCFQVGVLNDGILLELGTPSELKSMTTSQLLALVEYKKMMKYGMNNKKREAENLGKYYAVIDEIKQNHKQEEN